MVFKRLTKRRRKQARMGDPDAVPWRRTQARAEQTKESMSAINQVWASEQETMRICVWAKTQMQMHKSTDQHSCHARTHARTPFVFCLTDLKLDFRQFVKDTHTI